MKRRSGFRSTSRVVLDGMTVPFIISLFLLSFVSVVFQLPERIVWPIFILMPLLAIAIEAAWNWMMEIKNANRR